MADMTGGVAVVGSANLDIVVAVPRRPAAGETLLATGYQETPGGKGVNQALAAARAAPCSFIGVVGRDDAGDQIVRALDGAGVDLAHLGRGDVATGRAFIWLTPDGENSIVVLPLANHTMTADRVAEVLDMSHPAVVLTQLEMPVAVTEAVAAWCSGTGTRFMLNASPVRPLTTDVLAAADPIIVNQSEARALLDAAYDEHVSARALAVRTRSVVLTRGSRGALVAAGDNVSEVPGIPVTARDTTGAGDAFAGTLAAYLASGAGLVEAAGHANAEAARIVQLHRSDR
jgi:ribokinase